MWIRWLFITSQFGILAALVCGLVLMVRVNHKLDRDKFDRDLLRSFLVEQSNRALAAAQAVDPAYTEDRRKAQ